MLLILSVALLNPFIHYSFVMLENGLESLLRNILLWMYDIGAVWVGGYLLLHRKRLVLHGKAILFRLAAIGLVIACIEASLRILSAVSPRINTLLSGVVAEPMRSDPRFGAVPNPAFPGHDRNGYRNPAALERAAIVTIGDSFTYGTGVSVSQTWPQQLHGISGQSVYNMSLGGYGSIEAMMLVEQAISMHPSLVVFATYNGNDLMDAFRAVYGRGQYEEFKTNDPAKAEEIRTLEEQDPLIVKIKRVTRTMWASPYNRTSAAAGIQAEPMDTPTPEAPKTGRSDTAVGPNPSVWKTIKRSKVLRLFFVAEQILQKTFVDTPPHRFKWEQQHPDPVMHEIFDTPAFKTLFTPAYRHLAMNLDDPRVEEGLRISHQAIRRMHEVLQAQEIGYVVLLIPTKERVFYELYPEYHKTPSDAMQWLVDQESQIRQRTLAFLEENKIAYIDLLAVLRDCFKDGRQPYFMDNDAHFNAVGHAAVAQAVYRYLNEQSPPGAD